MSKLIYVVTLCGQCMVVIMQAMIATDTCKGQRSNTNEHHADTPRARVMHGNMIITLMVTTN